MTLSILHVAQPLDAGVPAVAGALVEDQVARGFGVSVAAPPGGDLDRAAERAGAARHPWTATRDPGPTALAEARRLAAIVAAVDPDLVHLHSAKAGLAGRLAIRGRRPTVFQPHSWSFEAAGGMVGRAAIGWERFAARWSDAIVCVSRDELERGEEVGVSGRFEVIPNGVDLSRFTVATDADRAAARAALDLEADAAVAVCIGRLAPQKDQRTLLEAWGEIAPSIPEARLALVGDGPDRAALQAWAGDGVRFAGAVDDVTAWLTAATVTVISSRWEAGLSLVAMEAMARGRSVVATDVAGMRDGIGGDAGAVVSIGDSPALARALAERLRDPAAADREGAAGRRRVEERYDVRVTGERVVDLYERVVAARS